MADAQALRDRFSLARARILAALDLIASGISQRQACRMAGCSAQRLVELRRVPDFAPLIFEAERLGRLRQKERRDERFRAAILAEALKLADLDEADKGKPSPRDTTRKIKKLEWEWAGYPRNPKAKALRQKLLSEGKKGKASAPPHAPASAGGQPSPGVPASSRPRDSESASPPQARQGKAGVLW